MKKLYLVLGMFLLAGCATPGLDGVQKSRISPQQNDITIPVEEGTFVVKNIRIYKEFLALHHQIKGEVLNNTTADWQYARFEVVFYDSSENKLVDYEGGDSFIFAVSNIKKGEIKPIYGPFLELTGPIARREVRFKYGEYPANYIFTLIKPKESKNLHYEDEFLNIVFLISKEQISFVLKNKTESPIKIDWNQVSYVDVLSNSHKVMHSGVKYINKEDFQPPTIVPPTAKLEDIIFPTDYVYYDSAKYSGGWRENPLFPEAPAAKILKGQSFNVFMPLEINGVIKNYLFAFKIEDVES